MKKNIKYNKCYIRILLYYTLLLLFFLSVSCGGGSSKKKKQQSDTISPKVKSVYPENGSQNISTNAIITALFSEPIDKTSITLSSFYLSRDIDGIITCNDTTIAFRPSKDLSPDTLYTATITEDVKDISGNKLETTYVWSFATGSIPDTISPEIIEINPLNRSTSIPINTCITVTFSEPIDVSTITDTTFIVIKSFDTDKFESTSTISGALSYNGTTATFTPAENLDINTEYTVNILSYIKDIYGNPLGKDFIWTFTTGSSSDITPPEVIDINPWNEAKDVPLNTKITVTFSEIINISTLNSSTFYLNGNIKAEIKYTGKTAVLYPQTELSLNTTYIVTITDKVKDLAGNTIKNNYTWQFTTGTINDYTPPKITNITPMNNAEDVPINTKITVTFSEPIDATTINQATLYSEDINGTVTYNGTVATFTPSEDLSYNRIYKIIINKNIKDIAGNKLESDYVWSFKTGDIPDTTSPKIIEVNPKNGSENIQLNTSITAAFSEPIDISAINSSTFYISGGITGKITYSGITLAFIPSTNLSSDTVYSLIITKDVKDLAGNALESDYIWSFKTGSITDITLPEIIEVNPLNGANNIPINSNITVTFSEPINALSITTSTFYITLSENISGTVEYNGIAAIFKPLSNLSPNTTYTAVITNSIKDLSGNKLKSDFSWSFTTGSIPDLTPPVITDISPLNNAVNVKCDANITAVFSEPIDATTISIAAFYINNGLTGEVSAAGNNTISFKPFTELSSNTIYTATITDKIKDLAGNKLEKSYIWSFTTEMISWTSISAGKYHNAAIKSNGTLWTWGYNEYGQIGNGKTENKNIPVKIGTEKNWMLVACGGFHTAAIKTDGTLWLWGNNKYGQIGNGKTENINAPVQIGTEKNWIQVACGEYHTAALKSDGTLWAWGYNKYGQIGDRTNENRLIPYLIGKDKDWIKVTCGAYHVVALKSNGTLWAWGNYLNDQSEGHNDPVKISSDNDWEDISAGGYHTLAIKKDNTLWAWGNNIYGQLGDGTFTNKTTLTKVGNDNDWIFIFTGGYHTIAIKKDSTLWAWGNNEYNQLGNSILENKNTPAKISNDNDWNKAACGGYHTILIKSTDLYWAWGNNEYGQLGDGTTINKNIPTRIDNDNNWLNIDMGGYHSMCTKSDSTLWTWGYNENGELGNGSNISRSKPQQIEQGKKWKNISSGNFHSIGIRTDGTLWTWGDNDYGQLGDGTTQNKLNPVQVGYDNNWIYAVCGGYHSIAIKSDGTLWAWGNNEYGQIGDGTTQNRFTPVQIETNNDWLIISAGDYHTLALKTNGTLWSWGDNEYGQIGDGTLNDIHSPALINSEKNWSSISTGGYHSMAIKSDGSLWTWGDNEFGQLGDETNEFKNIPIQIGDDSDWSFISAGGYHSLALKSNNTLWAWGDNENIQIGDGTTENKNSPVQIGINRDWVLISAGGYHSSAKKTDNSIWTWGYNKYGQLGIGIDLPQIKIITNPKNTLKKRKVRMQQTK
ncbi:MAG: Ig-like domain-containing protein [Candidatus Firestonebacteria bacterium]|nr:Ig-like domain-containing protein [Candidatus Firestonebacteria bacterium]